MKNPRCMVAALLVAASLGLVGCSLTDAEVKAIVNSAGVFSAVTWVGIDNPDTNAIKAVSSVLYVIKDNASKVGAGQTYTEVIYPEIEKVIDEKVESQYRMLCKSGATMLLGQLDLLFVKYPEWKEKQDKAVMVVTTFIDGVEEGFKIEEGSAIIKQARKNGKNRNATVVQ